MKKTTILLGMLSVSFAYAQQTGDPTGKVGVNTNAPTETLEVKGTVKVQELPTEGANKIYNGQAAKNGTFTPKKTVVADAYGVLGVVENIVEAGSTTNTALRWDDNEKKWKAVPGSAGGGTDTSIYNNDGAIPAGANRMVTLTDPGTGGTTGATLNFTLPNATNKAFNIIQGDGARGFSLSTKAGQTQNLINFFNDGATAQGYLGFTTDNDFRIKNEKDNNNGKILLESALKLGSVADDATSTNVLVVDAAGLVGKRELSSLGRSGAWLKRHTTDFIEASDRTSAIYRNSNIGIGDFSGGGFESSLHIKKANNANSAYKFATFQISDKEYTANDLASTLDFTDTRGTRYALIGDISTSAKNFEVRGEKGYNVTLASYADTNTNDKALIELSGEGQHSANDNSIKIKFNTGRWNNNTTNVGVTTVSRHGNWYFGADASTTPADQKVVIGGGLKFTGDAHTGLSHNKNPDTPRGTVPEGTMFYNNGHFFGVIPEGGGKKWKQLDNVDYIGANGITITGNTISLPTGTANQVLTWNPNAVGGAKWEAQNLPTAPAVETLYTANGTIANARTVTLNNSITWTGGSGFNIVRNEEALSLKASEANKPNFIGFYRNGGNTRTGYVGFGSGTSSDFMIDNEITSGKILMKDAVKVEAGDYDHITFVSNSNKTAANSANHTTAAGKVEWSIGTGVGGQGLVFRNNTDDKNDKLILTNNGSLYLRKPDNYMSVQNAERVGFAYNAGTGKLGIGVATSPSESIDVSGTARLRGLSAIGAVNNKLLVADRDGVVKSLVGATNGQVLTWNNNKWEAQTPTAGVTDNLYTANGTISVGTNRMVTLANPATGGRNGAKLNFTLSDGTDKAFNIIQADGTKGFSLSTKGANQTQNLINFFNNGDTRQAYLGFTTANDFRIKNEKAGGKIFLENEVKIGTINDIGNSTTAKILVADADGVVRTVNAGRGQVLGFDGTKWTPVSMNAGGSSPFRVAGGTNPASSSDNTANIYHNGVVGIGDFSGKQVALIPQDVTNKKEVKLVVNGAVAAGSFKGTHGAHIFPDYVFQKYYTGTSSIKADYAFQSLSQVEDFVKTNGHLPGYKSAADIKAQGYIDVMETQISNVEKIEELYLHTIEQEKALKEKDAKIKALEERLERLEKLIK